MKKLLSFIVTVTLLVFSASAFAFAKKASPPDKGPWANKILILKKPKNSHDRDFNLYQILFVEEDRLFTKLNKANKGSKSYVLTQQELCKINHLYKELFFYLRDLKFSDRIFTNQDPSKQKNLGEQSKDVVKSAYKDAITRLAERKILYKENIQIANIFIEAIQNCSIDEKANVSSADNSLLKHDFELEYSIFGVSRSSQIAHAQKWKKHYEMMLKASESLSAYLQKVVPYRPKQLKNVSMIAS